MLQYPLLRRAIVHMQEVFGFDPSQLAQCHWSALLKMIIDALGHGLRNTIHNHQVIHSGATDGFGTAEMMQDGPFARWPDA